MKVIKVQYCYKQTVNYEFSRPFQVVLLALKIGDVTFSFFHCTYGIMVPRSKVRLAAFHLLFRLSVITFYQWVHNWWGLTHKRWAHGLSLVSRYPVEVTLNRALTDGDGTLWWKNSMRLAEALFVGNIASSYICSYNTSCDKRTDDLPEGSSAFLKLLQNQGKGEKRSQNWKKALIIHQVVIHMNSGI